MSLSQLCDWWNEFFFKPQSPLPIAVFRILYGVLLLTTLLVHFAPDFDFWYGPNGIMPGDAASLFFFRQPTFNVLAVLGHNANLLHVYFYSIVVAGLFLTIGLGTRYSAFYCFLGLVSLHNQDPFNINGGDNFLRLVPLYLSMSQCGERLSVDRLIKRRWFPGLLKEEYWPWAVRLVQIQIAIVYWQNSVAKLAGPQWISGTAVYYATRLQELSGLPIPYLFDNPTICAVLTWGALCIEVSLWTLIWVKECRYWVLLAGVLLHLGIDLSINLPIFEWLFICSYICFVEPVDMQRVLDFIVLRFKARFHKVAPPAVPVAAKQP
jgi:hypothetical protein